MRCKKILNDGQSCQAFAQTGQDYCFRHDPKQESFALRASRRGGENRALQGIYGQEVKLDSPDDVKRFLGDVINGVWTGQVPVPVGSSMGFLTRCWLDAYEESNIVKRLDEIEERLNHS